MGRTAPAIPLEKFVCHIPADVMKGTRKAAKNAGWSVSRWIATAMREKLAIDAGVNQDSLRGDG